jgi:phosphoenolpyruvate carboxykinase (ATP)
VAAEIDGVDVHKLQPKRLYEDQGRLDEYEAIVDKVKADRAEYLAKYEGLDPRVSKAGE